MIYILSCASSPGCNNIWSPTFQYCSMTKIPTPWLPCEQLNNRVEGKDPWKEIHSKVSSLVVVVGPKNSEQWRVILQQWDIPTRKHKMALFFTRNRSSKKYQKTRGTGSESFIPLETSAWASHLLFLGAAKLRKMWAVPLKLKSLLTSHLLALTLEK